MPAPPYYILPVPEPETAQPWSGTRSFTRTYWMMSTFVCVMPFAVMPLLQVHLRHPARRDAAPKPTRAQRLIMPAPPPSTRLTKCIPARLSTRRIIAGACVIIPIIIDATCKDQFHSFLAFRAVAAQRDAAPMTTRAPVDYDSAPLITSRPCQNQKLRSLGRAPAASHARTS
jgi:hypothetical protein